MNEIKFKANFYAGLSIERHGATLVVCTLKDFGRFDFEPIGDASYVVQWGSGASTQNAKATLTELLEKLALFVRDNGWLAGLGIASYGPFITLERHDEDYGNLHPDFSTKPLKGLKVRSLVESVFQKFGVHLPRIAIHGDASGSALGEVLLWEKRLDKTSLKSFEDKSLVYILVTAGVGVGVVTRGQILRSIRNPEIGPLMVRRHEHEVLPGPDFTNDDGNVVAADRSHFSGSLSYYADNQSIKDRVKIVRERGGNLSDLNDQLNIRAFYIAQAALACILFLSPERLIIGSDFGESSAAFTERVIHQLDELIEIRRREGDPLPGYAASRTLREFILPASCPDWSPDDHDFRMTTAYGMCLAGYQEQKHAHT